LLGRPVEATPGHGPEAPGTRRVHKESSATFVEPFDSVLDCITGGEYENWSQQARFSASIAPVVHRDLEHEIQQDEVEFLGIDQEESLFSGWRDDNFVLLALQSFSESAGHLRFVFHYKDAQALSSSAEILEDTEAMPT